MNNAADKPMCNNCGRVHNNSVSCLANSNLVIATLLDTLSLYNTEIKELRWILSGVVFPSDLGVDEKRDYLHEIQQDAEGKP